MNEDTNTLEFALYMREWCWRCAWRSLQRGGTDNTWCTVAAEWHAEVCDLS